MKISTKRVLKELITDFTGKDSHTGITLSYAWLANQFGHIALGFIPAFLLFNFSKANAIMCAFLISSVWLIFEIVNVIWSFFSQKKLESKISSKQKLAKQKFKLGHVIFDTFTDLCFFTLGAFLFCLSITTTSNYWVLIFLIILAVYLFFASKYWYKTKMYQFYACFPFQFTLSQWNFDMSTENKKHVNQFLDAKVLGGNHMFIYGGFGTGKTSLGVAILNELSIHNNSCLYKSATKLFDAFFNDDEATEDKIWNWRTANFLMIDDINPSNSVGNELVSPQKLLSFIDTFQPVNLKNRDTLKDKNVIWVLGKKSPKNEIHHDEWKQMLLSIGVNENKISAIDLSEIY